MLTGVLHEKLKCGKFPLTMDMTATPKRPTPEAILKLAETNEVDAAYSELKKIYEQCAEKGAEVPEGYVSVHLALLSAEVAGEAM